MSDTATPTAGIASLPPDHAVRFLLTGYHAGAVTGTEMVNALTAALDETLRECDTLRQAIDTSHVAWDAVSLIGHATIDALRTLANATGAPVPDQTPDAELARQNEALRADNERLRATVDHLTRETAARGERIGSLLTEIGRQHAEIVAADADAHRLAAVLDSFLDAAGLDSTDAREALTAHDRRITTKRPAPPPDTPDGEGAADE